MKCVIFLTHQLGVLTMNLLLVIWFLFGQDLSAAPLKENLDLPFDARGESGEEEDAPEVVVFYGQLFEGDGIFYVVDKSYSMRDAGELAVAQREVIRNIQEFSDRVHFGVIFFDSQVVQFPASGQPAEANPGTKSAAVSFVQSVVGASGSCCQQGLVAGLRMANLASPKRKTLIYVGDGGGTCGGDEATYLKTTLAQITAQNYQRVQINAIGVLQPSTLGVDFMKKLAATNGGTYTRIMH